MKKLTYGVTIAAVITVLMTIGFAQAGIITGNDRWAGSAALWFMVSFGLVILAILLWVEYSYVEKN